MISSFYLLSKPSFSADKTEHNPSGTIEITEIRGNAFVSRSGATPAPLNAGDRLSPKDRVRTGPGGSLTLALPGPEKCTIKAGEGTIFEVDMQKAGTSVDLSQGDVSVKIGMLQAGNGFTVTTPVAVSSVRGTQFQIVHRESTTSAWVFEGVVELSAFDHGGIFKASTTRVEKNQKAVISDAARTITVTAFEPEDAKRNAFEQGASSQTPARKQNKVKIDGASKAYYMVPSCELENNVEGCSDGPSASGNDDSGQDDQKDPDIEYQDFGMFSGDSIDVGEMRALLPYPESSLSFSSNKTHFEFSGTMMVCGAPAPGGGSGGGGADGEGGGSGILISLFQAGRVRPEIRVENGETFIKFVSKNTVGIKDTQVDVKEGLVAVTIPMLCKNCSDRVTALVEQNKCWRFTPTTEITPVDEAGEDITTLELPPIDTEPDPAFDITGSVD